MFCRFFKYVVFGTLHIFILNLESSCHHYTFTLPTPKALTISLYILHCLDVPAGINLRKKTDSFMAILNESICNSVVTMHVYFHMTDNICQRVFPLTLFVKNHKNCSQRQVKGNNEVT